MPVNIIRGTPDAQTSAIATALGSYAAGHPGAVIDLYRQGEFSVRVRVVDSDFGRLSIPERHDLLWPTFDTLSDDRLNDISTVLLLTPDEVQHSFANFEFDHPVEQVLL